MPVGNRSIGNRPSDTRDADHNLKVLINMLFVRFEAIWANKFTSGFTSENMILMAKREWALSLKDMNEAQLNRGLSNCKETNEWPPSIAEFIKACAPGPEEFGLPDAKTAFIEVTQNAHRPTEHKWSFPIVRATGKETGWSRLINDPEKFTWPMFAKCYQNNLKRLDAGFVFEDRPEAIAIPSPAHFLEDKVTQGLISAGVDEALAVQLAYYCTKPLGSDVRANYRREAVAALEKSGFRYDFPC